jgi:hypothetical protein
MPASSFIGWFGEIRALAAAALPTSKPGGGCDPHEVSAVSGHTIDQTQRILDMYTPRTYEIENAIQRWKTQTPPAATRRPTSPLSSSRPSQTALAKELPATGQTPGGLVALIGAKTSVE